MSDQDRRERYEYLKRKQRYHELKAKAGAGESEVPSMYTDPAAQGLRGAVQSGLGYIGEGLETIDRYAPWGAPLRHAVSAVQEGGGLGEAGQAFLDKYGEPAPSYSEIYEKAGVSGDKSIELPFYTNPWSGKSKVSPADIAGMATGMATDPFTYLGPGSTMAKLPTSAARSLEKTAAKVGMRQAKAQEHAAKAALGQNIKAYRDVAGMTAKGRPDPVKGMEKVRGLGKQVLEHPEFKAWSKTEDIGEKVGEHGRKVTGEIIGEMGRIVDTIVPEGAVSGAKIADELLAYADEIPETYMGNQLKNRIAQEAEFIKGKDFTLQEARQLKNQFNYKPTSSDLLESRQDMTNKINRIIDDNIEEAVDTVSDVPWIPDDMRGEIKSAVKKYREAKGLYGPYKKVSETAAERAVRDLSNRMVSPSDYGMGIGGGLAAATVGGEPITTLLLAGGTGLLNKVARERGRSFMAKLNQGLADLHKKMGPARAKYMPIFEAARASGSAAVLAQHQMLMQQDPEYRRALQQAALGAPKTEPYATIGNAMDAVGMGQLAMAGIMIPFGIAKMLKSGNLLSAAADLFKANKGESPEKIKSAFINAAKQSGVDMTPETLSNVFDKAIGAKPNKANQQSTLEKIGNLMDEISGKRRTKSDELFEMDRQKKADVIDFEQEAFNRDPNRPPHDEGSGLRDIFLGKKEPHLKPVTKDMEQYFVELAADGYGPRDIRELWMKRAKELFPDADPYYVSDTLEAKMEALRKGEYDVDIGKHIHRYDKKGTKSDDLENNIQQNAETELSKMDQRERPLKGDVKRLPKTDDIMNQASMEFNESETFSNLLSRGNKEAQSEGLFGITHADYLDSFNDFIENELKAPEDIKDILRKETQDTWDWHKRNGSLEDEI